MKSIKSIEYKNNYLPFSTKQNLSIFALVHQVDAEHFLNAINLANLREDYSTSFTFYKPNNVA